MTVLSKNLHPLDMEFEETGNVNVDEALLQFSKLSLNNMNNLFEGLIDLTITFSGDCEELKQISNEEIENKTYIPNAIKSVCINSLY